MAGRRINQINLAITCSKPQLANLHNLRLFNNIKKTFQKLASWSQFEQKIKPNFDFDAAKAGPTPDYAQLTNWAAHPNIDSKVQLTPEGIETSSAWKNGAVDCFFIYPTLYFGASNWNVPIDHAGVNELVEEMILPGQASVFNTCCRMFVPRYRQATFCSFLGAGQNGRSALSLAFKDILTAFDYYIKHLNEGRPFFIAGHSQGALHVMRLLEERIDSTALAQQLVAAYPIGFWFPMDKFGYTLKQLKPSESANSIHCVVAWDTYIETGRPIRILDRAEMWYVKEGRVTWRRRARKRILGVNPLNWKLTREVVAHQQHTGAVHVKVRSQKKINWEGVLSDDILGISCEGLSKPYIEQVSASIGRNGILYVSSPKNRIFKAILLPGKSLHLFDISLFYINLRKNINNRWEVYKDVLQKS